MFNGTQYIQNCNNNLFRLESRRERKKEIEKVMESEGNEEKGEEEYVVYTFIFYPRSAAIKNTAISSTIDYPKRNLINELNK